jgi:hypothetical protein
MALTLPAIAAAAAGALCAAGLLLVITSFVGAGAGRSEIPGRTSARWRRHVGAAVDAARSPALQGGHQRLRVAGWLLAGTAIWLATDWLATGIAVAAVGIWLPWLLGSARAARERIDRVEALATWCRRMADTLVGGGAIGLAQAITVTAEHAPDEVSEPVQRLAQRLRAGHDDRIGAVQAFADDIDDRIGDTVAAALALALHQQSVGVATVLRQLATGISRDVRARRNIEAERAESRQSIKMLLLIQAAVLTLLMLVPGFAAPYRSLVGQLVMAALLAGTVALLVWMRRLALGRQAPRFLGGSI